MPPRRGENDHMHLETELKLVCEPAVLGRIARHPAVRAAKLGRAHSEHLISRYFDTPDGKLRAAGLALRVRSTPRGWVQTLKGEGTGAAGMYERPEWEWPVPSSSVAGDLLASTPAIKALGGKKNLTKALASLAPAFETEFKRTIHLLRFTDGSEAELCLDLGEVRAQVRSDMRVEPICEAEIELRGGRGNDRDAGASSQALYELGLALAESLPVRLGYLSKAARGSALLLRPVRKPAKALAVCLDKTMSRADAFRTIVGACMTQMQANEAGLLAGRDDEYVHQMRVAIRRLRSAFAIFRQRSDANPFLVPAAQMRSLAQVLGVARDWDVFCAETIRVITRALPESAGLATLSRKATRLRRLDDRAGREAVFSPQYTRGMLQLGQLLPTAEAHIVAAEQPLPAFAALILQKRHRRLRKLGERMAEFTSEELHRFRINAKKLRYAAEFFHALFPGRRTQTYIRALSRLQDALGGLNDVANAELMVGELCKPVRPDDATTGILRGWLVAMRQQHLDTLPDAWQNFRGQERFWRRWLPAPALAPVPQTDHAVASAALSAPQVALVENATD